VNPDFSPVGATPAAAETLHLQRFHSKSTSTPKIREITQTLLQNFTNQKKKKINLKCNNYQNNK